MCATDLAAALGALRLALRPLGGAIALPHAQPLLLPLALLDTPPNRPCQTITVPNMKQNETKKQIEDKSESNGIGFGIGIG